MLESAPGRSIFHYWGLTMTNFIQMLLYIEINPRFEKETFLPDLGSRLIDSELYNSCQEPYNKLTQIFPELLDYHAPIRSNQ